MAMEITDDGREIELHTPRFSVDNTFPVPDPLPRQAAFCAFVGPPRSGKTSLTTSLLTQNEPKLYSGVYDHVFLFVPAASFASMKDSPFKSHDKVIHEFSQETLAQLVSTLDQTRKKGENTLVIIDDFMTELKNNSLRKDFERLVANRRHLRVSVWVISQIYRGIPASTRKMISHLFLFRPSNLRELETIREELVPREKTEFQRIFNYIFKPGADPHTFMMLDTANGEIYNRFAKIRVGPPS